MRTALAATAAAVCVTALTAGLAPAAYAGKLVHEDARRDVVKMEFSTGGPKESPAPRRADPDILRITVDYRPNALIIRTKYAALERRVGRMEFAAIETRDGFYFAQNMVMRRDRWQGWTILESGDEENLQPCAGAKHRYDYETNVSIWTIAPICVGRAPWVRLAGASMHFRGETVFVDHAFAKGVPRRPPFSARVWRG